MLYLGERSAERAFTLLEGSQVSPTRPSDRSSKE